MTLWLIAMIGHVMLYVMFGHVILYVMFGHVILHVMFAMSCCLFHVKSVIIAAAHIVKLLVELQRYATLTGRNSCDQ